MAAILTCSCAGNVQQNKEEVTYQGNTVTVDLESPILPKLNYATLAEQPFSNEFRTVGTVQAETGHFAEVNVPFDGRVTRSLVSLGTKVSAGQTLFEMSSPDFLEASKAYLQNVKIFEKAKAWRDSRMVKVDSYDDFKAQIEAGNFVLAHWDGTPETEARIKEETKATIRCIPMDFDTTEEGKCVYTGNPSHRRVLFARSY